jgi:hypothetical protein
MIALHVMFPPPYTYLIYLLQRIHVGTNSDLLASAFAEVTALQALHSCPGAVKLIDYSRTTDGVRDHLTWQE